MVVADSSCIMLHCRTCKARCSERKGTPLFDARLPSDKVESVLDHIAGSDARGLHDDLVALSPRTTELQFDDER